MWKMKIDLEQKLHYLMNQIFKLKKKKQKQLKLITSCLEYNNVDYLPNNHLKNSNLISFCGYFPNLLIHGLKDKICCVPFLLAY